MIFPAPSLFPLNGLEETNLKYAVICARYRGKWIFCRHEARETWELPGGHRETKETALEAAQRELYEETGLTLTSWKCRGIVTFLTNGPYDGEYMYLFTADSFEGELKECAEGDLQWVSRDFLGELPQWEGDKIFLDLMWRDAPFFLLTLRYDGERLAEAILNGKKIR